jgi:hypothetical protein
LWTQIIHNAHVDVAWSVSDQVAAEFFGANPVLSSIEFDPVAAKRLEAGMFPAPLPEAFGQFQVIVVVPDLRDLEPQVVSASSSVLFAAYLMGDSRWRGGRDLFQIHNT